MTAVDIPATMPDPVEVTIVVDGVLHTFHISMWPTPHVKTGLRQWYVWVQRKCRFFTTLIWLPASARDPTRSEHEHTLDEILGSAAKAGVDLFTVSAGETLCLSDAAFSVAQAQTHAAGFSILHVSPTTAASLADALDPQDVRPEFGVML
jgi:hypothetical protein